MFQGGDISKFFLDADMNKDNFISKAELKLCLEKIGHVGLTDGELNDVFLTLDANNDGRISYAELCKNFSEFSNSKAIKDPSHWSFYIFENIRRACQVTQKPLSELFGLANVKAVNLNDKIMISKD
jgi:Ca2+-binding EF-hand superfamily protein